MPFGSEAQLVIQNEVIPFTRSENVAVPNSGASEMSEETPCLPSAAEIASAPSDLIGGCPTPPCPTPYICPKILMRLKKIVLAREGGHNGNFLG